MIRHISTAVSVSLACSLFASLGTFGTASAQSQAREDQQLEEIVVTARLREERLQDIPLSISAFSAADIEEAGFQDLGDIALQTAGVLYDARATSGIAGRLNSNIRIRGAQVNSSLPHLASTSLFVDGVFALGGVNSMPLTDLERVEVIKGPQSAFFGRNTFAGAVNYVTKTPGLSDFETEIDVSGASYGQYELSAVHSGPIIEGKLGYQISARQYGRGNMFSATDGGGLGEESTQSVAGTLYWEPNSQLSVKLRAFFLHDDDGPPASGFLRGSDLDTCTGRVYPGRLRRQWRSVHHRFHQWPRHRRASELYLWQAAEPGRGRRPAGQCKYIFAASRTRHGPGGFQHHYRHAQWSQPGSAD